MNNDLISKSAVLTVGNVRKVTEYDEAGYDMTYDAVPVEAIEALPVLDAVPVVRCNMCKYYEQDTGFCQYFGSGNQWDGFCNKGARMDGESEEDTDGSQTD